MKQLYSRRLIYLVFIVPFLLLLILIIIQYNDLRTIAKNTKGAKSIVDLIIQTDNFSVAYNNIIHYERPLLIYKFGKKAEEYEKASLDAKNYLDSLKMLSGNNWIERDEIFELDSLFGNFLQLADRIVFLSKQGELDSASELLHSPEHDLARNAVITKYISIGKSGDQLLKISQSKTEKELRERYQILGLISLETILFLGFIFWRMRFQIVTQNKMLQQLQVFESSTDGVIVTDTLYKITFFNKSIAKLHGLESNQLNGAGVFSILESMGGVKCRQLIVDGLVNHRIDYIDFLHAKSKNWYRVNVFPLLAGYTFYIKNVTEIKKTENQLTRITQAIEQTSSSVVITDLKGSIEYVNAAFTKLTGYTFGDLIGKTPRILKSGNTSDAEYTRLWDNITNYKVWRGEFLNKKKNGESYWEYATISPILNDAGEIMNYLAIKENITERKQLEDAQKQLLQIIENTTAQITSADLNFNFIYANIAAREVLEIGDEDITQYNVAYFRNEKSRSLLPEITKSLQETGRWSGENSFQSKSGKEINVVQVVILQKNTQGVATHISSTAIDLTRIKVAEKEMIRLNEELREFGRHLQYIRETEKNKIAKEVHDELGQGLAAIKLEVSWLKNHLYDEKAILVQKADQILLAISEKIQAFHKIYASANTSMIEEIGLYGSVAHLIDRFSKSSFLPVKLESNLESEKMDPVISLALYRVLEDALSNIIRYAKAKQVAVILMKKENQLQMQIEDDGIGFDIASVDTKNHHGILSIRERVYALNGNFLIESQLTKGTKISIEIPI